MKRKIKLTACLMALIATVVFGFTGCMYIDGNDGQWHSWGPNCNDPNFTGMDCNEYGWWYFQNGVIDWNYTGMACNENGWWYFRNGQIDWGYTGFGWNMFGAWFYWQGQVAFWYTGDYGNYYIVGGHLDHEHNASKTINQKAATYTANGYTGDKVCSHCGKLMQKGTAIAKLVKYETGSEVISRNSVYNMLSNGAYTDPGFRNEADVVETTVTRHYYSDGSYEDITTVTHSNPDWFTYWQYIPDCIVDTH